MTEKISLEDIKQAKDMETQNPLYEVELSHHLSELFSCPTDSLKTIEQGKVSEWLTELLS